MPSLHRYDDITRVLLVYEGPLGIMKFFQRVRSGEHRFNFSGFDISHQIGEYFWFENGTTVESQIIEVQGSSNPDRQ